MYNLFKKGDAKMISKEKAEKTIFLDIIKMYSTDKTKSGSISKNFTFLDLPRLMRKCEDLIMDQELEDVPIRTKIANCYEAMGYVGYISGKEEDLKKLYVLDVYPVRRHRDNVQFAYSIVTQSVGSGKRSRLTVKNPIYNRDPIRKGDLILCVGYEPDGKYFNLYHYLHIY